MENRWTPSWRIGSERNEMAKQKKSKTKTLQVTLVRSPIGYNQRQKDTVRALGLRRVNQTVEHQDSPALRGMLNSITHLIQVEE